MSITTVSNVEAEILSVAEVKNYLRIDHDSDNELIENLIKTARETIENFVKKSIALHTYKLTLDHQKFSYLSFENSNVPVSFDGIIRIPLKRPPVIQILKFQVNERNIKMRDYKLEEINYDAFLVSSSIQADPANSVINIEYKAGFEPDKVPYQIKLAALMLISNVYQARFSNSTSIFTQGIKNLLTPFVKLAFF